MSISCKEFAASMETYGAKRLGDEKGSRFNISVPCFQVGNYLFKHSGSYYIVSIGPVIPEEAMSKAMTELGETAPGKDNFWYGEIHTIRGMITLAAILDNKYSKDFADKLTNLTYKKLLDHNKLLHDDMLHIRRLLHYYDSIINPFDSPYLKLKEPSEYLDDISLSVSPLECRINISFESDDVEFCKIPNDSTSSLSCFFYKATLYNETGGYTYINHFLDGENNFSEVLVVEFKCNDNSNAFKVMLNLNKGLIVSDYTKNETSPVTDSQLRNVITILRSSIYTLNERFVSKIAKENLINFEFLQ